MGTPAIMTSISMHQWQRLEGVTEYRVYGATGKGFFWLGNPLMLLELRNWMRCMHTQKHARTHAPARVCERVSTHARTCNTPPAASCQWCCRRNRKEEKQSGSTMRCGRGLNPWQHVTHGTLVPCFRHQTLYIMHIAFHGIQ